MPRSVDIHKALEVCTGTVVIDEHEIHNHVSIAHVTLAMGKQNDDILYGASNFQYEILHN